MGYMATWLGLGVGVGLGLGLGLALAASMGCMATCAPSVAGVSAGIAMVRMAMVRVRGTCSMAMVRAATARLSSG